jgi:peptidoglycan/LPS O-acetylase OafA/YrhL
VDFIYKPLLSNFDLFLIGFLINPLVIRANKIKNGIFYGLGLMVVLYIINSFIGSKSMVLNIESLQFFLLIIMPSFVGILTAIIIILFELSEKIESQKINFILRKTEIFGTLTYAIYVCHEPIFNFWMKKFHNHSLFQSVIHFLIALISVIIVSYVLHKYIESYFYHSKFQYMNLFRRKLQQYQN